MGDESGAHRRKELYYELRRSVKLIAIKSGLL